MYFYVTNQLEHIRFQYLQYKHENNWKLAKSDKNQILDFLISMIQEHFIENVLTQEEKKTNYWTTPIFNKIKRKHYNI